MCVVVEAMRGRVCALNCFMSSELVWSIRWRGGIGVENCVFNKIMENEY